MRHATLRGLEATLTKPHLEGCHGPAPFLSVLPIDRYGADPEGSDTPAVPLLRMPRGSLGARYERIGGSRRGACGRTAGPPPKASD
jgi:hypothetical protein